MLLKNMSTYIGQEEIKPDISWTELVWKHVGNVNIQNFELEDICKIKSSTTVTLPLLYNYIKAKKLCYKMGGGKIAVIPDPDLYKVKKIEVLMIKFPHLFDLYCNEIDVCM